MLDNTNLLLLIRQNKTSMSLLINVTWHLLTAVIYLEEHTQTDAMLCLCPISIYSGRAQLFYFFTPACQPHVLYYSKLVLSIISATEFALNFLTTFLNKKYGPNGAGVYIQCTKTFIEQFSFWRHKFVQRHSITFSCTLCENCYPPSY